MTKEEVPSVNPKLDAMCEMLKTIHDLNERNKMLEAQIEKMKNQWNCANNNGYCISSICPCKDKWELKEN